LNIKKRRRAKRMSQNDLAIALNVTQGAISHWENGNCIPQVSKLVQLADVFGCSVDELLQDDVETKTGIKEVR
jgi:transcriptional regulator with XRE-family HTH domain